MAEERTEMTHPSHSVAQTASDRTVKEARKELKEHELPFALMGSKAIYSEILDDLRTDASTTALTCVVTLL